MKQFYYGFYATRVCLPISALSWNWRSFSRQIRGKKSSFMQPRNLPKISWTQCVQSTTPRVWEHERGDGNVLLSELAILSALAASCEASSNLFEIGTFDGRTTLNLAINSLKSCQIYTLDLPPNHETKFQVVDSERRMIEKPKSGTRYEKYRDQFPDTIERIHQLLGDSATFDYSPYQNSCSLVFVDGSHAYDYLVSDTVAAMSMVKKGGVIIWHDYGVWEGVTRGLEELEAREHYGLRNIRGTSLVYWKKP